LLFQILLGLAAVPIHVRTLYFAKRNDDGAGIAAMWRWIGRLLDFPPSWYMSVGMGDDDSAGDRKDDEKKNG
jgi:hypothetical protein